MWMHLKQFHYLYKKKKKKKISKIVSAALECSGTFSDVLKENGTKRAKIYSVLYNKNTLAK